MTSMKAVHWRCTVKTSSCRDMADLLRRAADAARLCPRSAAWHFASTKPGLALRQHEARLGISPARSPAWPFASAKRSLALVQLEARAGVPLARGPAWHPVFVKPWVALRGRGRRGLPALAYRRGPGPLEVPPRRSEEHTSEL